MSGQLMQCAPVSAIILSPRATGDGANLLCVQYRTVPPVSESYFYKNGQMSAYLNSRGLQTRRHAWRTRFVRKTYRHQPSKVLAKRISINVFRVATGFE